jgi:hypothetical protein
MRPVTAFDPVTELELAVAKERFRARIVRLALASVVVDLLAAVLAYVAERGAPHEFASVWAALFWTTTQLLTVSSQLPNPEHTATKLLDVALELYAIVVVTSLAATFTDALHHRTRRHVRERKLEARSGGAEAK